MKHSKRAVLMVAAWVVATAATAGVALAVVGLAGEQVADAPVRPLDGRQVEALGMPAADPGSPTTVVPSVPTTVTPVTDPGVPTTVAVESTTTTEAPVATTGGSTATTSAPATTSGEEAQIDSRKVTGGTVVVRWTSSWVEFVSATPDDGFDVDVEDRGPEHVEVEFEGEEVHSRYRARIVDGRLTVETVVENDED